jgi:hypothetical protein
MPEMAEFRQNQPKTDQVGRKVYNFLGETQLCEFRLKFSQNWWNRNYRAACLIESHEKSIQNPNNGFFPVWICDEF